MSKGRGRRSDTLGTMHRKTEAKMEELKRISRRAYLYGSQGGSTMTGRLTTGAPPFQELPNADKEQTIAAFMDSYNKMKDFEQQRELEKIAADEELIRSRGVYDQVPVLHPSRYPKHENGKGQLLGGFCNTTRCNNIDAVWFNAGTRGYYCSQSTS